MRRSGRQTVEYVGLLAGSLADLLEARKHAMSAEEVTRIAALYGIDVGKLESVARYVNVPSVKDGSTTRTVSDNGDENISMLVRCLLVSLVGRYG